MTAPVSAADRSIRRYIFAGAVALAALVAGFGGWAATAGLSGAVVAAGRLVTDSDVRRVQHRDGGVVRAILVREGDRVAAGDVVVRLDQTKARAGLAIVRQRLDELAARASRLEAERDGLAEPAFPERLTSAGDAGAAHLLAEERRLFEARAEGRLGQQAQLRERIKQLRQEAAGLRTELDAAVGELGFIEEGLVRARGLQSRNLIMRSEVIAQERQAAEKRGERGRLQATLAQVGGRIAETELQILQIDRDRVAEAARDLAEARAEAAELEERRIAAEDELAALDIRAPGPGIVHELAVHTVGEVTPPGGTLMAVVPEGEDFSAEARIAPEDVNRVSVGAEAILRFPALNQRTTPEIAGRVVLVSADIEADPRTGAGAYSARIEIAPAELARLGPARLLPGMPVEIFVRTEARTVLSYLLKPLTDRFASALRED